jgi:hypothetical protein
MITIKSKNFRDKIGKVFGVLVGNEEVARGVHLKMERPATLRIEMNSDRVLIKFTENAPKLKVNLWPVDISFSEIEEIRIYEDYAIIKLNNFEDA